MDKFTELKIDVKTEGTGRAAQKGDTVAVHYTGHLTDGTVFDSSYDRGEPIEFPVGVGMVIPGWDQSLLGMREGTAARLSIPSDLGYGPYGAAGVIPPHADLIFDIELVKVG